MYIHKTIKLSSTVYLPVFGLMCVRLAVIDQRALSYGTLFPSHVLCKQVVGNVVGDVSVIQLNQLWSTDQSKQVPSTTWACHGIKMLWKHKAL